MLWCLPLAYACLKVGQTQSQALQTLQDQQGQILAAVLPLLPLLQAVPLHVENARNNVRKALSDSQKDVKLWITGLEDRVKQSSETLGNRIRQPNEGVLALQPHVLDPVSDLRQHISTPLAAASSPDRLARGTLRSRSASQKLPRSGSPSDTSSSDPAASPSASKKRRLDNPSGRAASPARSARPSPGTSLRRIHTPTVPTTAPPSSSHASPDLSLLPPAVVRSSDRLVRRVPLADLAPTSTPTATLRSGTSASIASSSAPKRQQLRGSCSTARAHTRSSPSPTPTAAPVIAPNRTFSTQSNKAKAQQARTLPLAPTALADTRSAAHNAHTRTICTPPPICAAPITPGAFKLPLPSLSLGLSRTATMQTTPQLQLRDTLNRRTSSLRHPAVGDESPFSSRTPGEPQPSHVHARSHIHTLGLAATSRGVAVHDTCLDGDGDGNKDRLGNGSARVSRVGLPVRIGVGAGGGTPRTPRLPPDARSVAPPPLPPPPSAGKPMSLRDRRAMRAEDRLVRRLVAREEEEGGGLRACVRDAAG